MFLWLTLNRYMSPERIMTITAQFTEISPNFRKVLGELHETRAFSQNYQIFYAVNNRHKTNFFFSDFLIKKFMSSFDKKCLGQNLQTKKIFIEDEEMHLICSKNGYGILIKFQVTLHKK